MADNIVLNIGSGGATLATDEAGTPAKHYQKVKLVDGTADSEAAIPGDATNGLDVDVTRLPALPAGTNNIGDVDVLTLPALPAGTNNIGDVDVLTLPALPAGTNNIGDVDVLTLPGSLAGKAEDSVAGDADAGLPVLGVRNDAAATKTSADGDYGMLALDPAGRVGIADLGGSVTVDVGTALPSGTNNIGDVDVLTLPALPAGTNNIGDVDVVSVVPGTGATSLGKAVDSASGATDTGVAPLAIRDDALAALTPLEGDYVALRTDANGALWTHDDALDAALAGSELQVDVVAALPAGTNNIGDVDVLTLPALPAGTNNIGDVDVASFAAGAITEVQGDVAHDAAAAGNPVLIGARANANEPAAVADADATHLWADLLGRLVVLTGHPSPEPPVTANGSAAGLSVIAAPGVGVSIYVCKGSMHNRAATETVVSLREGAAGTIRFTANLAPDGGGSLFDFGSRGWKLPANTALIADIGQASVDINITDYYLAP